MLLKITFGYHKMQSLFGNIQFQGDELSNSLISHLISSHLDDGLPRNALHHIVIHTSYDGYNYVVNQLIILFYATPHFS